MEIKVVENKKDVVEIEFDEKTLPNVLVNELNKDGVDAYVYENHPLFPGYRLHIEGEEPMKKLKKAVGAVEDQWTDLKKELVKGIKGG
jgi:DNA-directed RNA polymerase subunit L